jgi:hypothetical protein
VNRAAAERWIGAHVEPAGAVEYEYVRPWATVARVPLADGTVWFKACAPVQAFEVRLSAALCARWPDLVAAVLAHDEEQSWLLLADAGKPIGVYGNPPEAWLEVLPRYAELQRGEGAHAAEHVAHGVPDLRLAALPGHYAELLRPGLPLEDVERERLGRFEPRFADLCDELAASGVPETMQHDDLHHSNVYDDGGRLRVLDWGDSCIGHPFASLVVTFHFLETVNKLAPDDPWFRRLRDAYLEPWGGGLDDVFALAQRVGTIAHAFAWTRQRDHLPESDLVDFDKYFRTLLERVVALAG